MILMLLISIALGQENDDVVYQKETEIDFESLEIEGQLLKPHGAVIQDRSRATFNPLIQLRTEFNVEMHQSVTLIK